MYICMHSGEFKIDHECVQNTKIKLVHLYSNTLRMTVHIKGVMAVYTIYMTVHVDYIIAIIHSSCHYRSKSDF